MAETNPIQPSQIAPQKVHLAELLGALSFALDLTEGAPPGHCVRACWIGYHMGQILGFSDDQSWELYYTILLKDLGCSSTAARICQLYVTDDISFKRDLLNVDGSLTQVLSFIMSHTGLKQGLAERFRTMLTVARTGGEARQLVETRCQTGAKIARQLRFPESVAEAITSLDEHWDGKGFAERLKGTAIPAFSQIALLAQIADIFAFNGGAQAALEEIKKREGSWFGPEYVAAFQAVAANPEFWSALHAPDIEARVFDLPPAHTRADVDEDYLDDIAAAFARVVDSKSPYTSGHSERVTVFSDMIAEELGFDDERRRILKRGALLHDIGKLGVSNSILDKPGKLNDEEWAEMRRHAEFSEMILSRVEALQNIALIGGRHHEKLDGTGYPKGLTAKHIDLDTRIVTVADIFDALTADRPYRAAMSVEKALGILREDAGQGVDGEVLTALERALHRLADEKAA